MKVLVTGAQGLLGREVCRVFSSEHEVIATDIAELDVTDLSAVRRMFAEVQPELVVNCAARTDVDGCEKDPAGAFDVNAAGAWHVATACREIGAELVHLSSDYVFAGDRRRPYREHDPTGPMNVYGRSKLEGEQRALLACPRTYVVRSCGLFGAHGKNFVTTILEKAAAGETLRVVNDQTVGAPTYVPDLAQAILRVVATRAYGVYHIVNTGVCTWFDFARLILQRAGFADVPLEPIDSHILALPAERPAYCALECGSLRALGLPPLRSYEEALEAFLEELRAAGRLPQR